MTLAMLNLGETKIRPDLQNALASTWDHIAAPGCHWTGAQRITIASETRHAPRCGFCRTNREALSPYARAGEHDAMIGTELPRPIIDIIHRLVTDPGRLTKGWFTETIAAGVSLEAYVETVGIVAEVTAVDSMHMGLGLAPPPLPEPIPGAPREDSSPNSLARFSWVPTVAPREATGALAECWFPGGTEPYVPRIMQTLSHVPREAIAFRRLSDAMYLDGDGIMDYTRGRAITRAQMELVAARVSAVNECFY